MAVIVIRNDRQHRAFTLIEMMVVVAIIGLLIGALLPAFNVVRGKARNAQAVAQFNALATGLQAFKAEQALGGSLPPSASDNSDDPQMIANPRKKREGNNNQETVRITGAHLLVHAMMGADQLGVPGFRDVSKPRDGLWWNDAHDEEDGIYEIDETTGREKVARYGGGGYVDDKMKEKAVSLQQLVDKGIIQNLDCSSPPDNIACDELFFSDPWGAPILYYRANSYASRMLPTPDGKTPGIYRQQDNAVITGSDNTNPKKLDGLDFGPGRVDGVYHAVHVGLSPNPSDKVDEGVLQDSQYDNSFARFIMDPSIKARPTPYNRNSYLLISAGPDGRYGTEDDVTNWTGTQDD